MREILFRGKRTDNGKWVCGDICHHDGVTCYIGQHPADGSMVCYDLDPDTVGQFTGLTDRNGKRIFEGDIVRNADGYLFSAQYPFAVKFCDGNFCGDAGGFVYISGEEFRYCEVIGNIHENPELLEVGE